MKAPLALRNKHLRALYLAKLLSSTATWISTVATTWWLLQTTGSAAVATSFTLATAVPFLLFTLYGGSLADRHALKRPLILLFAARGCCVLLSAAVVAGLLPLYVLVLANLAGGSFNALSKPGTAALLPELANAAERASAASVAAAVTTTARLAGPALGGVLLVAAGPAVALLVNAASYAVMIVMFARLPLADTPPQHPARPTADAQLIGQGSDQHWRSGVDLLLTPPLRTAVTLWIAGLMFTPLAALLPLLVQDVHDGDPRLLGALLSAVGAGGAVATALLLRVADPSRLALGPPGAVAGGSLVAVALAPRPAGALVACVLLGAALAWQDIAFNARCYARVARAVAGRVRAAVVVLAEGVVPFTAVAFAYAGDRSGVRQTVLTLGIVLAVICLGTFVHGRGRDEHLIADDPAR